MNQTSATELRVRLAASAAERERCYELRRAIFLGEQGVPEADEFDGLDDDSRHVLATTDGLTVGCLRFRRKGDAVKVERVATRRDQRRKGIGRSVMRCMEREAAALWPGTPLLLHAQEASLAFYDALGYTAIGAPFQESGIPHQAMVKLLLPDAPPVLLERRTQGAAPAVARRLLADVRDELDLAEGAPLDDLDDLAAGFSGGAFYIVHLGPRIAGIAGWARAGTGAAELRRIALAPTARALTLGRQLLALMELDARYAGCARAALDTPSRLHEALALYERHGYRRIEQPCREPGCDVRLEKQLTA